MTETPGGKKALYIFLDEAGNFDFSNKGTAFFTFTSFSLVRPFDAITELVDLKYDIWESGGLDLECFHASEDRQMVRDRVFDILRIHLPKCRIDCQIVEKRKTNPTLQIDHARFYHKILNILLRYVLKCQKTMPDRVIVVSDRIPVEKKRKEIEKATKLTLAEWSRESRVPYILMFHSSKSDLNLQIADYLNWAIFRKWEKKDLRSYDLIKKFISSEYETFGQGTNLYY
ncbi:DUF3800 domain-containing protein [bacterium]|nr:MAG: DUF3800 domain-containing protein [bacterium]